MKKLISFSLAAVMLFALTACDSGKTVATINGDSVSETTFRYYLTSAKSILSSQAAADDATFWETGTIDGENAGDVVKELAIQSVARAYVIRQMAIATGNDLSEEDKAVIEQTRQNTITQLGGEDEYKKTLSSLGVTDALYREVLENNRYEEKLYGIYAADYDDATMKTFYTTEMFRVKNILISSQNSETSTKLSVEQLAVARATAEDIAKKAKAGSDFDDLMLEYSEDPGSTSSPNGYLMSANSNFVKPFLDAALALKNNQVSDVVETTYGFHILKRLPVLADKFTDNLDDIKTEYWNNQVKEWQDNAAIEYKADFASLTV